jgi:biopolymer transport protein ExbB/TolQ
VLSSLLAAFEGPGAGFMYTLTAVMAFGLAVLLERGYLLLIRWHIPEDELLQKIASDPQAATAALANHPSGAVVKAGLAAPQAAVWDAMGAAAARVEVRVSQRVPYLATVGNIATMLGLLGTVYGLIVAFQGLGDASTVERAARLSEGIATAMATTAYGLLVGIPALAAHAFLDARVRQILSFTEAAAAALAVHRAQPDQTD